MFIATDYAALKLLGLLIAILSRLTLTPPPPPLPLDGDSATIRNFGQSDTNRNRNGKSAVEAPWS